MNKRTITEATSDSDALSVALDRQAAVKALGRAAELVVAAVEKAAISARAETEFEKGPVMVDLPEMPVTVDRATAWTMVGNSSQEAEAGARVVVNQAEAWAAVADTDMESRMAQSVAQAGKALIQAAKEVARGSKVAKAAENSGVVVARAGAKAQAKAWETVEAKARSVAAAASWVENGMSDWADKVPVAWEKAGAAWGNDAEVVRAAGEVINRADEVAKKAEATVALAKNVVACYSKIRK